MPPLLKASSCWKAQTSVKALGRRGDETPEAGHTMDGDANKPNPGLGRRELPLQTTPSMPPSLPTAVIKYLKRHYSSQLVGKLIPCYSRSTESCIHSSRCSLASEFSNLIQLCQSHSINAAAVTFTGELRHMQKVLSPEQSNRHYSIYFYRNYHFKKKKKSAKDLGLCCPMHKKKMQSNNVT